MVFKMASDGLFWKRIGSKSVHNSAVVYARHGDRLSSVSMGKQIRRVKTDLVAIYLGAITFSIVVIHVSKIGHRKVIVRRPVGSS